LPWFDLAPGYSCL